MQYAPLIYGDEAAAEQALPAAKAAITTDFDSFTASIAAAGKYCGGEEFGLRRRQRPSA
jgi:hypothetical protein